MVDENVTDIVAYLNALPYKEGISHTMRISMIVLGKNKMDCRQLKVTFGAYCEVYIRTTNTLEQRSVGVIALHPSNNNNRYWFMSLESGKRIYLYIWSELLIPNHICQQVKELTDNENTSKQTKTDAPYSNRRLDTKSNSEKNRVTTTNHNLITQTTTQCTQ